ncbi:conserved hypothetical protein [Aeromonas veronii]|uniref:Uncharacterized protein n=1 Tax=Aeromonas veronii TaxID=654 RepID=A0A653L335_AERVE|nr:conserved hypothetical protein [Aeromonas veronii]
MNGSAGSFRASRVAGCSKQQGPPRWVALNNLRLLLWLSGGLGGQFGGFQFALDAADLALFGDRDTTHQYQTGGGCDIQRREGAGPAGQTEDGGAIGDHAQTQFGEAVTDEVSEGPLDAIGHADALLGDEAHGGDADQQLRTKHQEAQGEQGAQEHKLGSRMLVETQGGDDQRQRHAGNQTTTAIGQIGEVTPHQGADQSAHFEEGKALNSHVFGEAQLLVGIDGRPLVDTDTHHVEEDVGKAEQPDHLVQQHVLHEDLPLGQLLLLGGDILFARHFVKQLFHLAKAVGFRRIATKAQADKADDQRDDGGEDKHAEHVAIKQVVGTEQRHTGRTGTAHVVGEVPHAQIGAALVARGPLGDGGVAARTATALEETAQGIEEDHEVEAETCAAHAGTEAQHAERGEDQHQRQELLGVLAVGVVGDDGLAHPVGDGEAKADHAKLGHGETVLLDHVILRNVEVLADQIHGQIANKYNQIRLHKRLEPELAPGFDRQIQGGDPDLLEQFQHLRSSSAR